MTTMTTTTAIRTLTPNSYRPAPPLSCDVACSVSSRIISSRNMSSIRIVVAVVVVVVVVVLEDVVASSTNSNGAPLTPFAWQLRWHV